MFKYYVSVDKFLMDKRHFVCPMNNWIDSRKTSIIRLKIWLLHKLMTNADCITVR